MSSIVQLASPEEYRGGELRLHLGTAAEPALAQRGLDADGSGLIDMNEYIRFSLRDALSRSAQRVIDLFRKWDEDGNGTISKKEFRRAVRALGFDFFANAGEIDMVFDDFDMDGNGTLDYKELNKKLRQGASVQLDESLKPGAAGKITTTSQNKHKLRKGRSKGRALPDTVKLRASANASVQDQLVKALQQNSVRVIDLFREWDEDADGLVDKKEFRKAIAALGYDAPSADINAVFAAFDEDGSGKIEYGELQRALALDEPPPVAPKLAKRGPSGYAAAAAAPAAPSPRKPQAPETTNPNPPARRVQAAAGGRKSGNVGGLEGVGDPYEEVALLIEAAPMPLRVVGMPTGEMDTELADVIEEGERSSDRLRAREDSRPRPEPRPRPPSLIPMLTITQVQAVDRRPNSRGSFALSSTAC